MAEGKRYYWLKLYDDFFDSKRIKKLRQMAGGDTFTIIYLKIQLKAMKTNGRLEWTGLEEDFAEELALDLDENKDNVKAVICFLLQTGLAETSDNINFFFPYSVANTGSEGASAQRMRDLRQKQMSQCDAKLSQCAKMCEIGDGEIEKEIEIEKDIEKEQEKKAYGPHENAMLTKEEFDKLKSRFPSDYQKGIDKFSNWFAEHPKAHFQSHYATIASWLDEDQKKKPPSKTAMACKPSYDLDKYEANEKPLVYKRRDGKTLTAEETDARINQIMNK